jgi:hypothetical protein
VGCIYTDERKITVPKVEEYLRRIQLTKEPKLNLEILRRVFSRSLGVRTKEIFKFAD